MYEEEFAKRLSQLRIQKGVSARDMSLSIGQNPGYINNIETGKALPSMSSFFFICDFLNITPQEFFDTSLQNPVITKEIISNLNQLSPEQLENISFLIQNIIK